MWGAHSSRHSGCEEMASWTSRACRFWRWACRFQIYMPDGHVKNENKWNEQLVETCWIQRGASWFQIYMPEGQVDIFHVVLPWTLVWISGEHSQLWLYVVERSYIGHQASGFHFLPAHRAYECEIHMSIPKSYMPQTVGGPSLLTLVSGWVLPSYPSLIVMPWLSVFALVPLSRPFPSLPLCPVTLCPTLLVNAVDFWTFSPIVFGLSSSNLEHIIS